MNPALVLLMRLQARAVFRRAGRTLRTPKGVVFALIGAAVFVPWLASVLFAVTVRRPSDPETVRLVAPLVLLLMCVLTLVGGRGGGGGGDRAISFTPGEVNFLFPGPFTRRELLLYKLARTFAGAAFGGLMVSLVLLPHAAGWPAAFAGGVLGMLLVQLLAIALVLAAQAAGARAYSLGRRVALAAVVGVALLAVVPAARELRQAGGGGLAALAGGGVAGVARTLQRSPAARVMLAPFVPFARTFTAPTWTELLLWGAASAAINAALLALVVRLDADYREAALAASQRLSEQRERARRGKVLPPSYSGAGAGRRRRSRLGMFRWFGGAGPTAWRQAVTALRTSRGALLLLLIIALSLVPIWFAARNAVGPLVSIAGWGTVMLTALVKFDFRGDLDQMEWLKALPLRPTATAAGQLAVPVLFLTGLQALLFGGAAGAVEDAKYRMILLAALPFLPPFNLLMFAVENLLFLLFPARTAGAAPGDIAAMGRNVVLFLAKLLVVAFTTGVAAAAGAVAYVVARSPVAGVAAALVALTAIAVALVPCVGWAYKRYDPSTDTPA